MRVTEKKKKKESSPGNQTVWVQIVALLLITSSVTLDNLYNLSVSL